MSEDTIHVTGTVTIMGEEGRSPRGLFTALMLCVLLGIFGAHRLYVGKFITAGIMLMITLTGSGLFLTVPWAIFDFCILLFGIGTDSQGRRLRYWG